MLEVKIDLIPFGNEKNRKTLESIYIWNVGTVREDEQGKTCLYSASRIDPRNDRMALDKPIQVEHLREDGALKLVEKVLHFTDLEAVP